MKIDTETKIPIKTLKKLSREESHQVPQDIKTSPTTGAVKPLQTQKAVQEAQRALYAFLAFTILLILAGRLV